MADQEIIDLARRFLVDYISAAWPRRNAEKVLDKLLAEHGLSDRADEVIIAYDDTGVLQDRMSGAQRALIKTASHPTLLDFPEYIYDARYLEEIHILVGSRPIHLFNFGDRYLPLLFRLQPLSFQRRVVQSEAFRKASPAEREMVMVKALIEREGFRRQATALALAGAHADLDHLGPLALFGRAVRIFADRQNLVTASRDVVALLLRRIARLEIATKTIGGKMGSDYKGFLELVRYKDGKPLSQKRKDRTLAAVERLNQPLGEDEIKALQAFEQADIIEAIKFSGLLNAKMEKKGLKARVTPAQCFDLLQGRVENPADFDPLLFSWLHAYRTVLASPDGTKEPTLLDMWEKHAPPAFREKNQAVVVALLHHCEDVYRTDVKEEHPICYSLPALAEAAKVREPALRSALFSSNSQREFWLQRKGKWYATELMKGLTKFFRLDEARTLARLFVEPDPLPVVKAEPPRPAEPKAEPPKTPWEKAGMADAEALFGKKFETPDALINEALKLFTPQGNEKAMRAALTEALQNPRLAIRYMGPEKQYALPSIPHAFLMWAADPATDDKTPANLFTALAATWDLKVDDAVLSSNPAESPQGNLALTALEHARAGVEERSGITHILSYADFLRWNGVEERRDHVAERMFSDLLGFMDEIGSRDQSLRGLNSDQREHVLGPARLLQQVGENTFGRDGKGQLRMNALFGSATRASTINDRLSRLLGPNPT